MKDFILFNLFSTIEIIGMFCLILALFRFKIKEYVVQIVVASFLLSQISYYMRTILDVSHYVPLIFLVFAFIFMRVLFRVQVYYAASMIVIGYIAFTLLQAIIIFASISLNLFKLDDVVAFSWLSYYQLLISCLISLIISWVLLKKRIGFTFVPYSETVRVKISGENTVFFVIVLLSVAIAGINLYFSLQSIYSLILIIVLLTFSFGSLIYLSIRREKQDG